MCTWVRWTAVLTVLNVLSCGRTGYDDVPPGGDQPPGGEASDAGMGTELPPSPVVLALASSPTILNSGLPGGLDPELVWRGDRWALSWRDGFDGELRLAMLSANASVLAPAVAMTNSAQASTAPQLDWTGSELGLVWHWATGGGQLYFSRADPAGALVGGEVQLTSGGAAAEAPAIAWTGSEHIIVWNQDVGTEYAVWMARLSPTGAILNTDIELVRTTQNVLEPGIQWTGDSVAVAWRGSSGPAFGRFDITNGQLIGAALDIGGNPVTHPRIAFDGTHSAITWHRPAADESSGEVVGVAVIAADGSREDYIVHEVQPTHQLQRSAVTTIGDRLAVGWTVRDTTSVLIDPELWVAVVEPGLGVTEPLLVDSGNLDRFALGGRPEGLLVAFTNEQVVISQLVELSE